MLRLGVLGGGIGSAVGRAHMSALHLVDGVEVAAGTFSQDAERNVASGRVWGVKSEAIFRNYDELLEAARRNYDVLVILTPTDQHDEQVLAAAACGVSVICEKALTDSTSSASAVESAFSDGSASLSVIFNYTGYPLFREMAAMVEYGTIGTPHRIELRMPQESFLKRTLDDVPLQPQSWRLHDGEVPTVSLDLGVHLHSLAYFLLGGAPPQRTVAVEHSHGNFRQVVDGVDGLVKYDGEVLASYTFGKTSLGNRNGISAEIYGSQGALIWAQESPDQLHSADVYGRRQTIDRGTPGLLVAGQRRYERFKAGHPTGFVEALANYYEDVIAQVVSGTPNSRVLGATQAREGIELMNAFSRSHCARGWVEVRANSW